MLILFYYVSLQDEKTSVHYVISTIDFSCPTILLLKSNYSNSKLLFVWDKILSNANDSYRQGGIKLVDENGKIYQTNPEVAIYLFSEVSECDIINHKYVRFVIFGDFFRF